ncbi:MAG TPA: hypothetical protein VLE89_03875 [Chlamydiales bacterium]|nr:hypothetical protein [Chlamydiales bacterium]
MRKIAFLFSFIFLASVGSATVGVRANTEDSGLYYQDSWYGPGWYYGVWFGNEEDFWAWRGNHSTWHNYHRNWSGRGHWDQGHWRYHTLDPSGRGR